MNGLFCRSCPQKYPNEATHFAHPKDNAGEVIPALDNWPVCENHVMMAFIAGWEPTPIIEETPHKMYGV